ncbi:hypothetical protein JB92DRAFT_2750811 [Gautieria morchelliformis]|nr:hypothetical protein JB92DRAFT_2750811 [Gautieria morchelliformis]
MCPKFCITYNAAYKDLEACPICSSSRYDEFQLATSCGHDKVPAQQYYTMPLGPQLQALWRNPETAQYMKHCRIKMQEILHRVRETRQIDQYDDLYHGSEYLRV